MCSVDKASWLEVSLQVTPEQAEAVAEVLGRFTPEGVVVEQLAKQNADPETHMEPLVKVSGYLFADAHLEEKKQRLEEALFYLGRIQPLPDPVFKRIQDENWMTAWKDQYKPLKLGGNLAILPAWADNPYPERIAIRINPGMAFGTGTHPTTQLCLEMMEYRIAPGMDVIDVGCGSGILSIAAVLLGAGHAYGTDISAAAVQSSRENAELNHVSQKVSFMLGSVGDITSGSFGVAIAPLVIVNILATIIMRLFDENLGDLVSEEGGLILSGILDQQAPDVLQKAQHAGFSLVEKREIEDWVGLYFNKKAKK
jgi:ribosomal protein L11 methyltransferase